MGKSTPFCKTKKYMYEFNQGKGCNEKQFKSARQSQKCYEFKNTGQHNEIENS